MEILMTSIIVSILLFCIVIHLLITNNADKNKQEMEITILSNEIKKYKKTLDRVECQIYLYTIDKFAVQHIEEIKRVLTASTVNTNM